MSTSSRSPSVSSPVELEPVVCWPLLIGAVSFVALAVVLVGGFAAWSALHPAPQPTVAAEVASQPGAVLRQEGPIDLPAAPVVRNENDRVVKVRREVIQKQYTPRPRQATDPSPPSPPPAPTYVSSRQPSENPWLQGLRKEESDRKPLGFRPTDDLGGIRMKKLGEKPFPLPQAIRGLLE